MKRLYVFLANCFFCLNIIYSQNATISFSVTTPLCYGDCNGTVCANVSGGNAPYTYLWTNGSTSNCINSVCAGNCTLIVTDASAISTTSIVNVTQPGQLFLYEGYCGLPCYATNNGSLCVNVLGGTPPYIYTYNGQNYPGNFCVTNAAGGINSYTVTDGNGCMYSDTTYISQHPQTTGTLTYTNPSCSTCCDGIIEITPTVNNNVLSYSMFFGGTQYFSGNNIFTNLCVGDYTLTINNGSTYPNCTSSYSISIGSLTNWLQSITKQENIEVYPNPTNSILNIADEYGQLQNATIEIKNYLGQVIYFKHFTNQIDLFDLSTGMYFLTVQNSDNRKTIKFIKE